MNKRTRSKSGDKPQAPVDIEAMQTAPATTLPETEVTEDKPKRRRRTRAEMAATVSIPNLGEVLDTHATEVFEKIGQATHKPEVWQVTDLEHNYLRVGGNLVGKYSDINLEPIATKFKPLLLPVFGAGLLLMLGVRIVQTLRKPKAAQIDETPVAGQQAFAFHESPVTDDLQPADNDL